MADVACAECKMSRDHHMCLNCGEYSPCILSSKETSGDPNWPGAPCTFEYTHYGITMHTFKG